MKVERKGFVEEVRFEADGGRAPACQGWMRVRFPDGLGVEPWRNTLQFHVSRGESEAIRLALPGGSGPLEALIVIDARPTRAILQAEIAALDKRLTELRALVEAS